MKRYYFVKWLEWDRHAARHIVFHNGFENKADAMAEFERIEISLNVPKVQVWEQLCKNDGFVQAQRRLAIKEF